MMNDSISDYNAQQPLEWRSICKLLASTIDENMPVAESKLWHGSPVWFLAGNPIVGYHVLKGGVRLLFWSGQSFDEPSLQPEGSFKAAETRYTSVGQVDIALIQVWLKKAQTIQWDYKNIVKRKGKLERL
jgi:hypothetical protein